MKILIVSDNYPSERFPSMGVFVYNLIQQFAKIGHEVTVISPQSQKRRFSKPKGEYGLELAKVYRPFFFSASDKDFLIFNTNSIGEKFQAIAITKVVKKYNIQFDVVYAHFLSNAFVAVRALRSYGKPIFAAIGEYDNLKVRKEYYSKATYLKYLNQINGFIAVSPQIKMRLIEYGAIDERIIVKPNAVDFSLFHKRDKLLMRKKYGFSATDKLIIFVGRFLHNKGPIRVIEATDRLENLGLIMVGDGPQEIVGENVIFKGKVNFSQVPELLSAADLFVLPTLHEGSCNAIVEAMACGLPIVSSDIPEIKVQCSPSFSRLVNPLSVRQIEKAISEIIKDDKLLLGMSNYALEASKDFDIVERAQSILSFIGKELIQKNNPLDGN
tara:strand:- start:26141 stop:27292 length:1152 start_codon:yes stop_codon:yes gene_type:complete